MEHQYAIEGMLCSSCTQKVAAALERVPGIARASVSLTPPLARVEMHEHVPISALRTAVAAAGPYRLSDSDGRQLGVSTVAAEPAQKESIYPLVLIVAYLSGAVLLIEAASGSFALHGLMRNFMAGFFLVFSFFKLLDLRGFSDAYRSYDLVARAIPAWGLVYPFVELALGVAYLSEWHMTITNAVTLALMLLGAVGVFQALAQKRAIRCACLGTVLNLPMTTVTLVEDLGMAAMAGIMPVLSA